MFLLLHVMIAFGLHAQHVHLIEHHPVDTQLLVDASDHHILLHGLITAPDEVMIEIGVHVHQPPHVHHWEIR